MPNRSKLVDNYTTAAVVVLNTLVILLAINVVLWAGNRARIAYTRHAIVEGRRAELADVQRVHPGMSPEQLQTLEDETYLPVEFEPYTMFREAPRTGDAVSVDAAGFRRVAHQGAWPPDTSMINIFVFGGSTTFGYGVTDSGTVPSALQAALAGSSCGERVRVYNFGRGYYYSAQERVLFEALLTEGYLPRIAIFLDGLNDAEYGAQGKPEFTNEFAELFRETEAQRPSPRAVLNAMRWIPIVRATNAVSEWMHRADHGPPPPTAAARDSRRQELAVARWLETQRLIRAVADAHRVPAVFVWQPASKYEYDLTYHVMRDLGAGPDATGAVYALMDARRKAGQLSEVLWLADMQLNRREALYVDDIHYTAAFAADIAARIAAHLRDRRFVC